MHLDFYRFLCILETDHSLCDEIKDNVKDFFQNEKSVYKMCYGIEILFLKLEKDNDLFASFYQQDGHLEVARKLESFFSTEESVYKF